VVIWCWVGHDARDEGTQVSCPIKEGGVGWRMTTSGIAQLLDVGNKNGGVF
jgi:hypothetical protein